VWNKPPSILIKRLGTGYVLLFGKHPAGTVTKLRPTIRKFSLCEQSVSFIASLLFPVPQTSALKSIPNIGVANSQLCYICSEIDTLVNAGILDHPAAGHRVVEYRRREPVPAQHGNVAVFCTVCTCCQDCICNQCTVLASSLGGKQCQRLGKLYLQHAILQCPRYSHKRNIQYQSREHRHCQHSGRRRQHLHTVSTEWVSGYW
jgi:hypothetical protein